MQTAITSMQILVTTALVLLAGCGPNPVRLQLYSADTSAAGIVDEIVQVTADFDVKIEFPQASPPRSAADITIVSGTGTQAAKVANQLRQFFHAQALNVSLAYDRFENHEVTSRTVAVFFKRNRQDAGRGDDRHPATEHYYSVGGCGGSDTDIVLTIVEDGSVLLEMGTWEALSGVFKESTRTGTWTADGRHLNVLFDNREEVFVADSAGPFDKEFSVNKSLSWLTGPPDSVFRACTLRSVRFE